MNQVYNLLSKLWSNKPTNLIDNIKNVLSVIGILSIIYFLFFFYVEKPQLIKESEQKVKVLEKEINNNRNEIKALEENNVVIENEVEKLQEELVDTKDKLNKYKNRYENMCKLLLDCRLRGTHTNTHKIGAKT